MKPITNLSYIVVYISFNFLSIFYLELKELKMHLIYPCMNAFGGRLLTLCWNPAMAVSKIQPLCSASI